MTVANNPIVVCVINLKGGVGKSTITALLARYGVECRNRSVLAIDLDPQANLSQGLLHSGYYRFLNSNMPSIVELFNGYVPPGMGEMIPSGLNSDMVTQHVMSHGSKQLDLIASRFDFSNALLGNMRINPRALASYLSVSHRDKDLILIDCSPTDSIITEAAYHASGKILVPVKPEYFATVGFPLLNQSIVNFQRYNPSHQISVVGVVINNAFYDGGNNGGPEKQAAMNDIKLRSGDFGWPIYEYEIEHSRGYPKMMRGNRTGPGNAEYFSIFARQFYDSIGL